MRFIVQKVHEKTTPDDFSEFEALRQSLIAAEAAEAAAAQTAPEDTYAEFLRFVMRKTAAESAEQHP